MTDEIELSILETLWRNNYIGRSYTPVESAFSSVEKHNRGRAKDILNRLVTKDILTLYKGGECVSINPDRKNEVKEKLEERIESWLLDQMTR